MLTDGDRVWLSFVFVKSRCGEPATASTYICEATVINAAGRIVQQVGEGQKPRLIGFTETVHGTRDEAVQTSLDKIHQSIESLRRCAEELK